MKNLKKKPKMHKLDIEEVKKLWQSGEWYCNLNWEEFERKENNDNKKTA